MHAFFDVMMTSSKSQKFITLTSKTFVVLKRFYTLMNSYERQPFELSENLQENSNIFL
jgi:hypothetical protein